jgi:uncharacterized iron-regulated membrane protein
VPKGRARQAWVRVHRWLGLIFGIWFVLEGLTGTLLAFDYELDLLLNPVLVGTCARGGAMLPLDQQRDAAAPFAPGGLKRVGIPHGVGVARVYANGPGTLEIAVDRCTGQVLLVRDFDSSLVGVTYRIHANLLLGDWGRVLVGICGLILCVSIATGLTLWWPRKGRFRADMRIKRDASRFRLIWDLHRTAGATTGIVLVSIALTGAGAAFPETTRAMVGIAFPLDERLPAAPAGPPPGLQGAATAALGVIADGVVTGVRVPRPGQGAVVVTLRRPWEPMKYSGQTRVLVGSGDGVIAVRDPYQVPAGAVALDWIFPLHTGEALSTPGRAVVCLAGALPIFLFATGLFVWWYKRSARRAMAERSWPG